MFNIFKRKPTFELRKYEDNRFHIVNSSTGESLGNYSRARDAKRGAARMGVTLAE